MRHVRLRVFTCPRSGVHADAIQAGGGSQRIWPAPDWPGLHITTASRRLTLCGRSSAWTAILGWRWATLRAITGNVETSDMVQEWSDIHASYEPSSPRLSLPLLHNICQTFTKVPRYLIAYGITLHNPQISPNPSHPSSNHSHSLGTIGAPEAHSQHPSYVEPDKDAAASPSPVFSALEGSPFSSGFVAACLNDCSKSAMISSMCSVPTEIRMRS
jgi:hypothetical protein